MTDDFCKKEKKSYIFFAEFVRNKTNHVIGISTELKVQVWLYNSKNIKNKHFSHNYILYGRSKTIFHFSICTTDGLILLNSLYSFYLIILPLSLTKSVKSFKTVSINYYNCRLSVVPLFEIDQRKKYFLPLRNKCFQYSISQESGVRKTSYSRLKLRVIVLSLFKSSISIRTLSVFRLSQSSFLLS